MIWWPGRKAKSMEDQEDRRFLPDHYMGGSKWADDAAPHAHRGLNVPVRKLALFEGLQPVLVGYVTLPADRDFPSVVVLGGSVYQYTTPGETGGPKFPPYQANGAYWKLHDAFFALEIEK